MVHGYIVTLAGNAYSIEYDGTPLDRLRQLHRLDSETFPWIEPLPLLYAQFSPMEGLEEHWYVFLHQITDVRYVKRMQDQLQFQLDLSCYQRKFTSEIPSHQDWFSNSTQSFLVSINHRTIEDLKKEFNRHRTLYSFTHSLLNHHHQAHETPYTYLELTQEAKEELLRLSILLSLM